MRPITVRRLVGLLARAQGVGLRRRRFEEYWGLLDLETPAAPNVGSVAEWLCEEERSALKAGAYEYGAVIKYANGTTDINTKNNSNNNGIIIVIVFMIITDININSNINIIIIIIIIITIIIIILIITIMRRGRRKRNHTPVTIIIKEQSTSTDILLPSIPGL